MKGINCKTYIDGKGWLYKWEIKEIPKKTGEEMLDDMIMAFSIKHVNLGQFQGSQRPSRKWEEPTKDYDYIRELELNKKYRGF